MVLKYRLKKLPKRKILIWCTLVFLFVFSIYSMVRYYAVASMGAMNSGISGDTVVVNDLENDWNYYTSLNYTEITSKRELPTGNSNKYNQDTLVAVQINYDGHDINDSSLVGKISGTEPQSKLVYYKYYPVVNGKVTIELIDNPYTARPTGHGFNGWVCDDEATNGLDCSELTFSYDDEYYTRYVTIDKPANPDSNGDYTVVLNLKASWTTADVETSINTAYYNFKDKSMQNIGGTPIIETVPVYRVIYEFKDNVTYFILRTANRYTYYSGYPVRGGSYINNTRCNSRNGCQYLEEVEWNDSYDENLTYYVGEISSSWFGNRLYNQREAVESDFDVIQTDEIIDYEEAIVGYEVDYNDGDLLTGYYYKTTYNSGDDASLYYNTNGVSCDDTTCRSGSTVYKLIQYGENTEISYTLSNGEKWVEGDDGSTCKTTIDVWKKCNIQTPRLDDEGNIVYENGEIVYDIKEVNVNQANDYYYLVTRDTNILDLSSNNNDLGDMSLDVPYTLSGNYDGTGNGTVEIDRGSLSLEDDMVIEHLEVTGLNVSTGTSRSTSYAIFANDFNLKIGRGMTATGGYYGSEGMVAYGVISSSTGRNDVRNKVIVETGHYNYLKATGNGSLTDERVISWYGNDYDRVTGNDNNLIVEFQALASDYGNHNSSSITPTSQMVIKSGTYGEHIINGSGSTSTSSYYTYGVYAGGISGGNSTSFRTLKIEGGRIFSVNGGPCIYSSNSVGNVIAIYMTGGTVDNIVGGAGTSETYGNRIVSVTGGTVNNAVAGGSNSYSTSGGSSAGPFRGDTLVYIGGNAVIGGTPATVEGNRDDYPGMLYAVTPGSVFGAGLGLQNQSSRGVAYETHVIINGGTIKNNVYGGGNYGKAGYSGSATSKIDILDGVVEGSVFGGANSNGFGSNGDNTYLVDINMSGGTVGYLYGGSNSTGTVYADVDIDITGGTIVNDVFGGGYGSNTRVNGTINIDTKTNDDSSLIAKNIYGGSANGSVNSSYSDTTNVTIDGGTVTDSVYGAGKGETATPQTSGDITVTVLNGNINRVFGGNNLRGTLSHSGDELQVIVNGGTINEVFGGSNGSNAGATETNVTINGGRILSAVYGGGNQATTTTSNVTVNGGTFAEFDREGYLVGTAGEVYGGGYAAAVTTTNVNIENGSNVYNVYGGSNQQGLVRTSNVNNNGGNVLCNTYGGGNIAEVTTSNNNLNGTEYTYKLKDNETVYNTSCGNAFGGGAKADVNNSNITLKGSTLLNVYGGSNQAGTVSNSNVVINNGNVQTVFGGNNAGGSTVNSNVSINESNGILSVENVFGGSNGSGATIGGNTYTEIRNGTVTQDVFGGGNEAKVIGSTEVNMYAGTVRSLYGGGKSSFIGDAVAGSAGEFVSGADEGSTVVNVVSGTVNKNVYGSGNSSFVYGSTEVNIADAAIDELGLNSNSVNKVLTINGSVFGGSETNAEESTKYDYSYKGVTGDATINVYGKSYVNANKPSLNIVGSIYGSGNNSATAGITTLYVDSFGLKNAPAESTSVQRFSYVYINDSNWILNGDRDRANGKIYRYSFVRIDNLYLLGTESSNNQLNGSSLYLVSGSTWLNSIYSGTMNGSINPDNFVAQTTTENNGTLVNANSDNRIYMYANKVLSISASEEPSYDATSTPAGSVHGMTFLGMYVSQGDSIQTGIYNSVYKDDDVVDVNIYNQISSDAYTFVYGKHDYEPDEQIRTNGYYTNYYDVETNKVNVDYVGVTPTNALYYKWVIGKELTEINVDLQATRYSVDGAVNKTITLEELREIVDGESQEWRDATMKIENIDTSDFQARSNDVVNPYDTVLIDKSEIKSYNLDDLDGNGVVDANQNFALSMGTTSAGWLNNYKTNFYDNGNSDGFGDNFCTVDATGDCIGDSVYLYDSTITQRSLSFWLYYSKNLDFTVARNQDEENIIIPLGTIYIYTTFTNPHGDPTDAGSTVSVVIKVNVSMFEGDTDTYGKAISPGKKYEVFQNRPTSISSSSSFSIYQSLSLDLNSEMLSSSKGEKWSVDKVYNKAYTTTDDNGQPLEVSESYRYLNSSYVFPVGTKITMLDLADGEQYYYVVNQESYEDMLQVKNDEGVAKYMLEDFIRMGSTDANNKYDDDMNGEDSTKYYHVEGSGDDETELAIEEFVFTVDFSGVAEQDLVTEVTQAHLYMNLARKENGSERVILTPQGIPTQDMTYTIYPDVTSEITTTGGFVQDDGSYTDETTLYVGESTNLNLNTTLIQKDSAGNILNNVSDSTYDDYKLGAIISVMRPKLDSEGNEVVEDGKVVYERVTQDLFGTVISINGVDYFPQTDGTTRIELAGRITDVISSLNIDFANSSLNHDKYKLVVETFATYDGLYYGDYTPTYNEYTFELLNNQYGLDVDVDPIQVTHDVNTGLDKNGSLEINYKVMTKNGLADPNLKVSLQRRSYDSTYDAVYENIDLKGVASSMYVDDSATNMLDSCFSTDTDGKCLIYNLTDIGNSFDGDTYNVSLTMKNGPTDDEINDKVNSEWKSGTYRVIFTMYDGDVPVGEVYEYLIIRSLDVDE